MRHAGDEGEVVRDVERAGAGLTQQGGEQVEDVGTGDDVERGGGLIKDQQLGPGREGGGDQHALLLATGDLVWVAAEEGGRVAQADMRQDVERLALRGGPVECAMEAEDLADLATDGQRGVQRGRRVLEHHADAAAADRAQRALGQRAQILSVERDATAGLAGVARQRAHDGRGQARFAGAGLADQAEHLARRDLQRQPVQHRTHGPRNLVAEPIILDREQRHRSSRGLSMTNHLDQQSLTVLLVGASRGLGQAMAAELVKKDWHVVGTVREGRRAELDDLARAHPDRITIEQLDITEPDQIAALRDRLSGSTFDMLFVNAGTANHDQAETIAQTSTDEFVRVMLTNTLGVMRAVEGLQDLVRPAGLIGVMSSGQGSVANNVRSGHEVYRGSKAALNQYMRSYAARHADDSRAMVLMAPGWIRTELGGPKATFSMEETIPELVDTLIAQQGTPGLRFIDRHGQTVPW